VSTTGQNRRERRLTLTAEGRKRLAAAHPKWQQAQRRMRSAMSGAEWNAMFRAFRTTVDAADRAKRSYLAKVRTVER
jgi:DNA-binding MarR family transcriptional regulator